MSLFYQSSLDFMYFSSIHNLNGGSSTGLFFCIFQNFSCHYPRHRLICQRAGLGVSIAFTVRNFLWAS